MTTDRVRPLENGRHERFCQQLAMGASQTQAYLAAGYRCSKETARRRASQLVTKGDISARIAALKLASAERAEVHAAWVLRELKLIAGSSVADYRVGPDGEVKVVSEVREAIRALASVRQRVTVDAKGRKTIRTELRLLDKVRALELLGKHLGLWERLAEPGDVGQAENWDQRLTARLGCAFEASVPLRRSTES